MKLKLNSKLIVFFLCSTFIALFCQQLTAQTSVVTQHNNLERTGWNNTETILNTKNVKPGFFGKLYSRSVDAQIYSQLLLMRNVAIPAVGNKNIVFAATVNNSVYAFDADSANVTNPYWQINLTPAGLRPIKNTDMTGACGGNYKDFSGNMGIVGTPVIDSVTGTLYVVARSCASNGTGFVQYLHAIDITNGNEKTNSPVLITAQVAGTGDGSSGGIITFNAQKQNQRSGLLLLNGKVYIAYASHCDWAPYHGWFLGYDATTLAQTNVYNNTPDGYNGGIWMSGGAPSADAAGNIYIASGNGSVGTSGNPSNLRNRSETAEKITPSGGGFTVATFFTPKNYTTLEGGDLDFGVTQMMLLPNTNQVMVSCKDGKIYLLDRDNMGGYTAGVNNVVQTIDLGSNAHLHSSLTYYRGTQKEFVYSWSENTLLKAYPYNRTTNNFDLTNTINGSAQGPTGNSGAFLTVSSNGSVDSTAILWTNFASNGDANQSVRPGILHAFDATDVTKELWNSSQDPADNPGNYAKFNNPTVANGKVYLPTFSNQFIVYGLTGNADTCNTPDIALNKTAVASSSENGTNTADKAFDGNATTRWASQQQVDPQYIYVDLGARYDLCSVLLQWEVALGKNFTIDLSDDALTWTTLATKTNNVSFTNYIPLKGSGRYVRMNGTARGTTYGYSLYSFEVYGTLSAPDCATPDSLSTSDIYENSTTVHWKSTGVSNYNIQYKAVTSTNWTTVTSDTNVVTLIDLACGTDYLYKVQSACTATDTSFYSATSSFSQLPCGSNCDPLPTRWTTLDVGNTDIPGSACYTPDIFTLKGSGDDIGGTTDAFHFALKTLAGDGEFNARVLTLDQVNPSNKIGIMIRETLSPGSKYAFIDVTSGNGAAFQSRSVTDGSTSSITSAANITAPYWIKIMKTSSIYQAFISADNITYAPLGTPVDLGFGAGIPVYAGLAVTSHDNTVLSTSTVDNYLYTSGVLPVKLLSFTGGLNLSQKVDLRWTTTREMQTSYFVIERSASDNHFVAIDSVKANNNGTFTTAYTATDYFPAGGINFYRLKIVDEDGHYTYSALIMIRVSKAKAPLLYPNPAKTIVHISAGSDHVKYVTIYDISGKALIRLNNKSTGNVTEISTSNLMRGTYIVEITTGANVYRDKLIIQ